MRNGNSRYNGSGSGRDNRGGYGENNYGSTNSYGNGSYGGGNSSGFGGGQRFGGNKGSGGDPGSKLRPIDWSRMKLDPIKKNIYNENPDVAARSKSEIDTWLSENQVTLSGQNIPHPTFEFSEAGYPKEVESLLYRNYQKPTVIQAISWPVALSGRDIISIAKTGSGKTLGFILPAIMHTLSQGHRPPSGGPSVLVLLPTRELAQQVQEVARDYCRAMNLSSTCLFGGASKHGQASDLRRGVDVCIATPGRLLDFLENNTTNMNRCSFLVLDEADRMLDMGFEPQIRKIVSQIRNDRQTLMFSATWPKEIRQLAADFQVDPVFLNVGSMELSANHNIEQIVEIMDEHRKQPRLFQILENRLRDNGARIIIFVETKRKADELTREMRRDGWPALCIHGDKEQRERDWVLAEFKTGKVPILLATDVAARGLDVDDIKVVINYDMSNNSEDYVHRIGRTGRRDKTGTAYTFFTPANSGKARDLIKVLQEANQQIPPELMSMGHSGNGNNRSRYGAKRSAGGGFGRGGGPPKRGRPEGGFNAYNNNAGGFSGGALEYLMWSLVISILRFVLRIYFYVSHQAFTLWNKTKKRVIVPKPIDDDLSRLLLISAQQAAELIRSREISSKDLLEAYIRRIHHVNKVINAVVEVNFEEALALAKNIDDMIATMDPNSDEFRRLESEKPLLGVPFTAKDTIRIKGMKTTAGLVALKDAPVNEVDADVVRRLKEAGAIALAISNVPEAGLAWETVNKLFGRTNNPYDTRLTPGGSCGGETALLASCASVIGIGSDLGGSLRIPANFCGVFGLKPTAQVVSTAGHLPEVFPGYLEKMISLGPLVRYAGDLQLMLKVMVGPEMSQKLKLDKPVDLRKIRVFYMRGLDDITASPLDVDCQNALQRAVKYFAKKYDTSVYSVDFPIAHHALDIISTSMHVGEPGCSVANSLAGFKENERVHLLPELIRWLFGRSNHTAAALMAMICDEAPELLRPNADFVISKREQLKREVTELLTENTILLTPSLTRPQFYHNEPLFSPMDFIYTAIWNVLGLPVVAVPMGLNNKGLPTGIQIVGGPKSEALLIAVAKDLEEGFGGFTVGFQGVY
ncbi:DNA RNA helicase domain containing protein [Aphelenchoides besseyi]|nr:DNA RNA helicase domain containing protein [Aphelenchoides besseyi]